MAKLSHLLSGIGGSSRPEVMVMLALSMGGSLISRGCVHPTPSPSPELAPLSGACQASSVEGSIPGHQPGLIHHTSVVEARPALHPGKRSVLGANSALGPATPHSLPVQGHRHGPLQAAFDRAALAGPHQQLALGVPQTRRQADPHLQQCNLAHPFAGHRLLHPGAAGL